MLDNWTYLLFFPFDDPFDAVIQNIGEMQVTEGVHKVQLLLGKLELGNRCVSVADKNQDFVASVGSVLLTSIRRLSRSLKSTRC